MKKFSHLFLLIAILIGIGTEYSQSSLFLIAAESVSKLFMNLLQLVAGPIVFMSLFSTLAEMQGLKEIHRFGRKVAFYTFLTTLLASLVALGLFLTFDPLSARVEETSLLPLGGQGSYGQFLMDIVPSNFIRTFLEQKVISIAFLGLLFGIASHFLPEEERQTLKNGARALFQLILKVAQLAVFAMPFAIWAFTTIMIHELRSQASLGKGLIIYLLVILLANLVQGAVVIPLLLKAKGLSPWQMVKKCNPPLLVAFFTKSSNATLPLSLQTAEKELGISPDIVRFSLPLCTVINMNGCAAFILTTVLFVSGMHGVHFSSLDLVFWVGMSVLAAIGNAGVPMGCFFLTSALLLGMNVPLTLLGMILPFYALLDMVETALNVWSDLSVTAMIHQDCSRKKIPKAAL